MRSNLFAVLFSFLLIIPEPAGANFFNNILNKAKQAAEEIATETVEKTINDKTGKEDKAASQPDDTPVKQTQTSQGMEQQDQKKNGVVKQQKAVKTSAEQKPKGYSAELVRQVQVQLNQQGYNAGKADGIYGPGTRKAIEAFQAGQGIPVDGQPSQQLLSRLKQPGVAAPAAVQQPAAQSSDLPEPSKKALTLAGLHFRPEALDQESILQDILLTVHPDMQPVVSNEFKWHKQKDDLKQKLIKEAEAAALAFEVQPWRDSSISKSRSLELVKYDFDRQAFRVRFSVGNFTPKMLVSARAEPAPKYAPQIDWISIDPDTAEKIADYFGNTKRQVYLHYRFRVVGALVETARPVPVVEFENDEYALYAGKSKIQDNKMHQEFKHLATVRLPLTDTPVFMPIADKPPSKDAAAATDVVKNAEVDGITLGMDIQAALATLAEHGFEMETAVGKPSQLSGVTIEGKGVTADGAGWIEVFVYHMDGVVYRYQKTATYFLDKLPEGLTDSDLRNTYHERFTGILKGARYQYTDQKKQMHFDDSSPPPYNSKITSPHATVFLSEASGRSGKKYKYVRWNARIILDWKDLVGASW